jgi:chaperonin GroEL
LSATRAALEEGILPGGGIALLNAATLLLKEIQNGIVTFENSEEEAGAKLLIESCYSPLATILSNAGLSFDVIKKEISGSNNFKYGYDARNNKYCDMIAAGIIDPVKVTKSALENAVSIAGMMITTECTLMEEQPDDTIKVDA